MSTFSVKGKIFRYRDRHVLSDLNHCYNPICQDLGKSLVDYLARWENVGEVDNMPADAILFTCADHNGPGFEEAKKFFSITQKSTTAAYLTKARVEKVAVNK